MQERLRLLYVALTRAEKWLIVAAAGDLGKVRRQLVPDGRDGDDRRSARNRWRCSAEPACALGPATGTGCHGCDSPSRVEHSVPLPRFFLSTGCRASRAARRPLSPSDLGGAKALPGEDGADEEAAKRRGERGASAARTSAAAGPGRLADAPRATSCRRSATRSGAAMLAEARAVLTAPHLAELFAADTLGEVPVTAEMHGRAHPWRDRPADRLPRRGF